MLAGQGAQYVNMGWDLYERIPQYRLLMDRMFEHVKKITGKNIKQVLYPDTIIKDSNQVVQDIETSQLILFCVEYVLGRLLMDGGLKPYAMVGYSFGEYITACLAGVFSVEDVLKLIIYRGQLLEQAQGSMLSVPCPADELRPYLNQDIYYY